MFIQHFATDCKENELGIIVKKKHLSKLDCTVQQLLHTPGLALTPVR